MKKLLFAFLILTGFVAKGQNYPSPIYQKPNNSYGTISNRQSVDSAFFPPTGCGVPTDTTWLLSQGTNPAYPGYGQKILKWAIYYDSCGHHAWNWDPSLQAWHIADSSSGGTGLDTTAADIRYLKRGDSAANNTHGFTTQASRQKLADSLQAVFNAMLSLKLNSSDSAATNSHGYVTQASRQKLSDSLQAVFNALLAGKVTNAGGVSFFGRGTYASKPTSGTGIWYATDSASFFYINGAAATNMNPTFHITVNNLSTGYPLAFGHDSTFDFWTLAPGTNVTFDSTTHGKLIINSSGGGGGSDSGFAVQILPNASGIPLAKIISGGARFIRLDTLHTNPGALVTQQWRRALEDSLNLLIGGKTDSATTDSILTQIRKKSYFYGAHQTGAVTMTYVAPVGPDTAYITKAIQIKSPNSSVISDTALTTDSAVVISLKTGDTIRQSTVTGAYNTQANYFIGNSIAFGFYASQQSRKWSTMTCTIAGYTEMNFGVSGALMQGNSAAIANIPTYNAATMGYLFIELGVNDALHRVSSPGSYDSSLYNATAVPMLDSAIARGWPGAKIRFMSVSYLSETINPGIGAVIAYYNANIIALCAEFGAVYVDDYTPMLNNGGASLLAVDGIHPLDRGHALIASIAASSIRGNIKNGNRELAFNHVEFKDAYFKNLYADTAASVIPTGIDSTGKLVMIMGGSAPGLDQVAHVGNTTTKSIDADGGYYQLGNLILWSDANSTIIGDGAAAGVITNSGNTITGHLAAHLNPGNYNTLYGEYAGYALGSGSSSVDAFGRGAAQSTTSGTSVVAIGSSALFLNTSGFDNAGLGDAAGYSNVTGHDNTYIGHWAGFVNPGLDTTLSSLHNSTAIGAYAQTRCSFCAVVGGIGNYRQHLGVGIDSPTAWLHIPGGTTLDPSIRFQLRHSQLTTTPETGALEVDSVGDLTFTDSTSTRDTIATRRWVRNNSGHDSTLMATKYDVDTAKAAIRASIGAVSTPTLAQVLTAGSAGGGNRTITNTGSTTITATLGVFLGGTSDAPTKMAGATRYVKNIFSSGTSFTIPNNYTVNYIDLPTTASSASITLPSASPEDGSGAYDGQIIEIFFGGTITSGAVITSLTVNAGTGNSIIQSSSVTTANAADHLYYIYRAFSSSVGIWYRKP